MRAGPRPLDRVRSIKVKLGLLVVGSCTAVGFVQFYAQDQLGLAPRWTLPVAVAAAVVVTQVLARGMVAPLRELTAAAGAMARGDYSRRVRVSSRDEVGAAARAFNTMAAELTDVDRQRRELLANVSHELRTPVAGLQAVLENLVDGVTPVGTDTLGTALAQTERLGRLITTLLDVAAIDAGRVPLRREDVALAPLLRDAVREAQMSGRPVSYSVSCPDGLGAWADAERLRQVVANLLDNASRHGPPGSTVSLVATATDDGVRLDVADEGPGIDAVDRDRVFERFARGRTQPGADLRDGGTGLGLAISRWLVGLHQGAIYVADAPRGCLIRIDLPRRAAA